MFLQQSDMFSEKKLFSLQSDSFFGKDLSYRCSLICL